MGVEAPVVGTRKKMSSRTKNITQFLGDLINDDLYWGNSKRLKPVPKKSGLWTPTGYKPDWARESRMQKLSTRFSEDKFMIYLDTSCVKHSKYDKKTRRETLQSKVAKSARRLSLGQKTTEQVQKKKSVRKVTVKQIPSIRSKLPSAPAAHLKKSLSNQKNLNEPVDNPMDTVES